MQLRSWRLWSGHHDNASWPRGRDPACNRRRAHAAVAEDTQINNDVVRSEGTGLGGNGVRRQTAGGKRQAEQCDEHQEMMRGSSRKAGANCDDTFRK
jgi:hypothetical protein